ncbi:F-box domain-containing protein [Mycena kentingensis (nom. inval.)]|nr:F-box domain-containing protein [Mycena kentingensis (nom. inval.)]
MADNSLPDELISEILSPALKVPDHVFSDTSTVSPFARYTESTSAYLVVCKSWLRVATPLLYNVVILRSKDQAKALACALAGNRELGRFVKKLRVEGGYGAAMHTVLAAAPNITDMYLTFVVWTPDTVDGLCKGLSLINPSKLILRDQTHKGPKNKMVQTLLRAVVLGIDKWDNLTTVDWPYFGDEERAVAIADALAKAKRLTTLIVTSPAVAQRLHSRLASSCPINAVQLKDHYSESFLDSTIMTAELRKIITTLATIDPARNTSAGGAPPTTVDIAPSLNPLYVPMNNAAPDVVDAVWSRVAYFFINGTIHPSIHRLSYMGHGSVRFLLVSKLFFRVGIPHFYAHIRRVGRSYTFWNEPDPTVLQKVQHALSHQPLIETFLCSLQCNFDILTSLAASAGASLRHLAIDIRSSIPVTYSEASAVLGQLRVLRRLEWNGSIVVSELPTDAEPGSAGILPALTHLKASGNTDVLFYTLLAQFALPALESVDIGNGYGHDSACLPFLRAHGPKLAKLTFQLPCSGLPAAGGILGLCPNATEAKVLLEYGGGTASSPDLAIFYSNPGPGSGDDDSESGGAALIKLILNMGYWYRKDKELQQNWETFFMSTFTNAGMPRLEELQFPHFKWPTTERDIAKSHWVKWAESLLERTGVHMADQTGMRWKPRLKFTGRVRTARESRSTRMAAAAPAARGTGAEGATRTTRARAAKGKGKAPVREPTPEEEDNELAEPEEDGDEDWEGEDDDDE